MNIFFISIISLIIFYTIYKVSTFLILLYKIRYVADVPGPMPIPFLGNLTNKRVLIFMKYLRWMRDNYGKYVVFWRLHQPFLTILDPKGARAVMSDTKRFNKGKDYTTTFAYVFGDGLVTSIGEKHKKDRNLFSRYFIKGAVEKRLDAMSEKTLQMIDERLMDNLDKSFDLQDFFHILTLRIFADHAINYDFSKDKELAEWVNEEVSTGSNSVAEAIIFGYPMWPKLIPRVARLKKLREFFFTFSQKCIKQRREDMKNGKVDDIDDCMTAMIKEKMADKEIADHFFTLLAAGHDTTAYFLCYMTYLLAKHPDVQEKVREEIATVIGDRTNITSEDLSKLHYIRNVMQETLRLYAVIPHINRTAMEDVTLECSDRRIQVPKGTTMLIPIWLLNRDPDMWENPNDFNPDRWEGIGHKPSAKHGFFPFGYGSRTCVGMTLALTEALVIFSILSQRFVFEADPDFRPKIVSGISLVTKNGVRVIPRLRD